MSKDIRLPTGTRPTNREVRCCLVCNETTIEHAFPAGNGCAFFGCGIHHKETREAYVNYLTKIIGLNLPSPKSSLIKCMVCNKSGFDGCFPAGKGLGFYACKTHFREALDASQKYLSATNQKPVSYNVTVNWKRVYKQQEIFTYLKRNGIKVMRSQKKDRVAYLQDGWVIDFGQEIYTDQNNKWYITVYNHKECLIKQVEINSLKLSLTKSLHDDLIVFERELNDIFSVFRSH